MLNLLTADAINMDQMMYGVPPRDAKQGRMLYQKAQAVIQQVDATSAQLVVYETPDISYTVSVRLTTAQVAVICSCRQHYWSLCKHRVAALMTLRDYLEENPPSVWRAVLDSVVKAPERRASTPAQKIILFSLQEYSSRWSIVPYALYARHFPSESLKDAATLARLIAELGLAVQSTPIRSRLNPQSLQLVSADEIAAANLTVTNSNNYNSYYGVPLSESLLSFMPFCMLFLSQDNNPFHHPIGVPEQPARLELSVEPQDANLRVRTLLIAGDQQLTLRSNSVKVIFSNPLWLLCDNRLLVHVEDSSALTLISYPDLIVPPADHDTFLESYLLPLVERTPVQSSLITWENVEAPAVPRLYLSEAEEGLQADLRFGYADFEVPYQKSPPPQSTSRKGEELTLARIKRDAEAEQRAWQSLSSFGLKRGTSPGSFLLRKNIDLIDFLLHQTPRLLEQGYEIYGEQDLKAARVNRNRPSISFNISSGIDWFDVQAVVSFGDQVVPLKEIRRAIRKKERFIKLVDGSIGSIPEEWADRYRHLFALGDETERGFRLSQHHLTLIDQLLGDADRAQADEEFERRRQHLRDFSQITAQPLPEGFVGELRPYQKAGYDWLHFLHEYGFGGCLADDMGTGKTVATLAFLLSLRASGHATNADLVVLPRSLIFNWKREATTFAPSLRIGVYADANRVKDVAEFASYDLVLTTYGIMRQDIELLRTYRFHYIVLDESQAIKNPVAETSKAARLLQGEHRLALTGTPIENSTMELWSQFAFLNPGLLGNLDYFRAEFVSPIERAQSEDTAQFLRKMVFPFILRRTKDQVASDLPPRSERILVCEMEPAQRKLYEKQRDYYRDLLLGRIDEEGFDQSRMQILEGLLRLRQICNHPRLVEPKYKGNSAKFDLLLETLETLRAEGHKALIFSQFVQMLSIVRESLDERSIPYAYLDGQTRDRQGEVDRFQQDQSLPFFLISLKAGGVGLNLTAADYVIHIDPWWNPAVEQQATDRTHRIGQDKPVFVYKLVVQGSVEEKILLLQERKRALVEQLIASESGVFKSLTREDVEILFT